MRGRQRRDGQRAVFIVPMESKDSGSIVRRQGARAGLPLGGDHAALWLRQLSFSDSSRGLYLAAQQRCHCSLYKAMSSLHYDNMSPVLQRHHKIALAKKQITSIDPPPLLLLPVGEMLLAGKRGPLVIQALLFV